jgi:hypothetical protein
MPSPIDLARVTTQDLLRELQRRVYCADKTPRRTIFIGTAACAFVRFDLVPGRLSFGAVH